MSVSFWLFINFACELCEGLSGSLNRSSILDIKQEKKEDEENCSIGDRSEDEKKDMKARLGTRWLIPDVSSHLSLVPESHSRWGFFF